ncbi:MAG: metalloregulator ArsR/SmtB family transcription factor [Balneolaceae bacterium]
MAQLAKALGHPARMAIVDHLSQVNSCICGKFVEHLPLSQATVSQHLRELKSTGLIQGTIEGTSICYCLNPDTLNELTTYLERLSTQLDGQANERCKPEIKPL